jgi:hypothetical protein
MYWNVTKSQLGHSLAAGPKEMLSVNLNCTVAFSGTSFAYFKCSWAPRAHLQLGHMICSISTKNIKNIDNRPWHMDPWIEWAKHEISKWSIDKHCNSRRRRHRRTMTFGLYMFVSNCTSTYEYYCIPLRMGVMTYVWRRPWLTNEVTMSILYSLLNFTVS